MDKKSNRHSYSLQQALFLGVNTNAGEDEGHTPEDILNAEMAKRLKYTKDMLTHMLQDANQNMHTRMTGTSNSQVPDSARNSKTK